MCGVSSSMCRDCRHEVVRPRGSLQPRHAVIAPLSEPPSFSIRSISSCDRSVRCGIACTWFFPILRFSPAVSRRWYGGRCGCTHRRGNLINSRLRCVLVGSMFFGTMGARCEPTFPLSAPFASFQMQYVHPISFCLFRCCRYLVFVALMSLDTVGGQSLKGGKTSFRFRFFSPTGSVGVQRVQPLLAQWGF